MRARTSLLLCVALFTLLARAAALPALNPAGISRIDRMLQSAVSAGEVPGVVALVTNKERIIYLGVFGYQDVAHHIPMSTSTVFRIASMTKPITSTGIMMLYEERRLKLDDRIGDFLPAYKGREVIATFNAADASYTTRPVKAEITIRQLLTQTAGLAYPFTSSTVLAIQTKTGKDPKEMPLMYEPGTKWHYSPATGVLGDLIQKLSGQTIEEWDQSRVFRPLEMRDTT
jgi:CubicO group peptidase (beta-lactamase class C family)